MTHEEAMIGEGTRVALYARSTNHEKGKSWVPSIEEQLSALRSYCQDHNLGIAGE